MTFDLKSAVHFVTVAEEMSFSRAAQKLSIAQPWLSRRIRILEAQLGFALFERTTRRMELTGRGKVFLEAVRPMAEAAAAAALTARGLARAEQGRLRIGAPPYSARIPMRSALVSRLAAVEPDLALELEIGWTPLLLERLARGELDAMFGISPVETPSLASLELCRMQVTLSFHPDDPLAGSGPVAAEALAGRRVAVFPRGLFPALFDLSYGALEAAGAQLIQMPEPHEGLIIEDPGRPSLVVAIYRVEGHEPAGLAEGARRVLAGGPALPFNLYTPKGERAPALQRLWDLASQMAARPEEALESFAG